jgi:hypothetical protein
LRGDVAGANFATNKKQEGIFPYDMFPVLVALYVQQDIASYNITHGSMGGVAVERPPLTTVTLVQFPDSVSYLS